MTKYIVGRLILLNDFLPLNRKIMKHWLWEDKPFSKGQAWIDLLMLANYTEKKKPVNGEIIIYKRGNVNLSMKQLADRWGWDRRTVKRFLDLLSNDNMVSVDSTTHGTTITIVNYGVFNNSCTTNGTTDSTTNAHQDVQQNEQPMVQQDVQPIVQQIPTTNKDNNVKELEEEKKRKECEEIITVETEKVNRSDISDILQAWNELQRYGIKSVSRMNSKTERYKMLTARINEYGIEDILSAIDNIKQSSFLQGKNKNGWMITFDWFVRPNNFPKVLDGNYSDNTNNANRTFIGNSRDEQFQKLMEQIRRDEMDDN